MPEATTIFLSIGVYDWIFVPFNGGRPASSKAICLSAMSKRVITKQFGIKNSIPSTVLTRLLQFTNGALTTGTVEVSERMNIAEGIAWESVLSGVQKILNATYAELDINEDGEVG